jgi:hypothetical protein
MTTPELQTERLRLATLIVERYGPEVECGYVLPIHPSRMRGVVLCPCGRRADYQHKRPATPTEVASATLGIWGNLIVLGLWAEHGVNMSLMCRDGVWYASAYRGGGEPFDAILAALLEAADERP